MSVLEMSVLETYVCFREVSASEMSILDSFKVACIGESRDFCIGEMSA